MLSHDITVISAPKECTIDQEISIIKIISSEAYDGQNDTGENFSAQNNVCKFLSVCSVRRIIITQAIFTNENFLIYHTCGKLGHLKKN